VAPFRQGHKTDKNDALAVAEAANRPNIKIAPLKSIEHQAMQSIQRSRELIIQERTSSVLRSLRASSICAGMCRWFSRMRKMDYQCPIAQRCTGC
jgi:transposase